MNDSKTDGSGDVDDSQLGSIRRTVYFTGHVQGVGFRYTTRALASRFSVTGYVRNLADGRVALVVEADRAELDRFLAAVRDGLRDHIHHVQSTEGDATGEYDSFSIAR